MKKLKSKKESNHQDKVNIIRPIKKPKLAWEEAFEEIHQDNDDELLINDILNDDTLEEWR